MNEKLSFKVGHFQYGIVIEDVFVKEGARTLCGLWATTHLPHAHARPDRTRARGIGPAPQTQGTGLVGCLQ